MKTSFNRRFKHRPLSYSQLSAFEWSREEWFNKYVLDIKEPPTPAMEFGNIVGDSIGTSQSLVPDLVPPGVKEYELSAKLGDIILIGFADHYCPDTKVLHENKTSDNPTRWDQAKVDKHTQLDMYALMLFLKEKTKPEEITMFLNFIPVVRGGDMIYRVPEPVIYHQFPTKRTTADILRYATYITNTVKKMEEYYVTRTATIA